MGTYHRGIDVVAPARVKQLSEELAMPETVTMAMDQIAGACREGLLSLAVGAQRCTIISKSTPL